MFNPKLFGQIKTSLISPPDFWPNPGPGLLPLHSGRGISNVLFFFYSVMGGQGRVRIHILESRRKMNLEYARAMAGHSPA